MSCNCGLKAPIGAVYLLLTSKLTKSFLDKVTCATDGAALGMTLNEIINVCQVINYIPPHSKHISHLWNWSLLRQLVLFSSNIATLR